MNDIASERDHMPLWVLITGQARLSQDLRGSGSMVPRGGG